jgi:hypothetical protein
LLFFIMLYLPFAIYDLARAAGSGERPLPRPGGA